LRLLGETLVPARASQDDESLGSFARRRLGREAFERIVQPLVGGIYTADPEKLSLRATLPRFVEMERRHGSLIRAARRQRDALEPEAAAPAGGARYGLFVAPRDGLSSLIDAIVRRLPPGTVRLDSRVDAISRRPDGSWQVCVAAASPAAPETVECQGLIVAVGAPAAARLVDPLDRALGADLRRIEYAGTAIVSLAYRRPQIAHPLDAFGFVVPAVENRRILACSFASVKFDGRAPAGTALVRVFIGGACQAELAELPEDELRAIAIDELGSLIGAAGEPIFCDVTRWPRSMPQYHLGHCELVARIEQAVAAWPNFALAGNAYHGVGIPNCIHSGELAAKRVAAAL
jgi:oxygen-dependent protoporphyrinogen oxidase